METKYQLKNWNSKETSRTTTISLVLSHPKAKASKALNAVLPFTLHNGCCQVAEKSQDWMPLKPRRPGGSPAVGSRLGEDGDPKSQIQITRSVTTIWWPSYYPQKVPQVLTQNHIGNIVLSGKNSHLHLPYQWCK